MTVRPVQGFGPGACDCGDPIWRAHAPEHYAADLIVLEEVDAGPWRMDDEYRAERVGVDADGRYLGDLKIHHHNGDGPALGDVVELYPQAAA